MQQTAKAAPDGQVLAQVEQVVLARGRELARKSLEAVLNQQAEQLEKKGRRAGGVPVADRGTTGGRRERSVLTAAGKVRLRRVYFGIL